MIKASVISKSAVIATILALTLASFSATSVFAAGTQTTPNAKALSQNLTSDWRSQMDTLHTDQFIMSRFGAWKTNWLTTTSDITSSDKTSVNQDVSMFSAELRKADALAASHPGFDRAGVAVDNVLAQKTVNKMQTYLHDLHMILVDKIKTTI